MVKDSYDVVHDAPNIERVYYKDNELVVDVIDTTLGEQIYEVVSVLKNKGEIITRNASLKVNQVSSDKNQRVKWFSVDVHFLKKWKSLSQLEKLKEFVSFVENMKEKGFVIDHSKYNYSKCDHISEILSLFVQEENEEYQSAEHVINFVHSFLAGGVSLKDFYDNFVSQKSIFKFYEFPYSLPIVKMCYEYYKSGIVPERISNILEEEDCKFPAEYYLIATNNHFENDYSVIQKNQEYSIYSGKTSFYYKDSQNSFFSDSEYVIDGKIKIFNNMDSDHEAFFEDSAFILNNAKRVMEYINNVIVDLNGSIIGYLYSKQDDKNYHSIMDFANQMRCQKDLFDFLKQLVDSLEFIDLAASRNKSRAKYHSILSIIDQNVHDEDSKEDTNIGIDDLDMEKSIIYTTGHSSFIFNITTVEDLFSLVNSEESWIEKNVTLIFFKIFLSYITRGYKEEVSQGRFLDIPDVRVINPVLAREFVNFASNKEVDYQLATEALYDFFDSSMSNSDFCYDSRFEFNPLEKPFLFDYEAEEKYNVKLIKGMKEDLAGGSQLVIYKRSRKEGSLKEKIDSILGEIRNKIGKIEDNHVRIVGISEVIYSSKLNSDNMYPLIGYVREQVHGEYLTDEFLLGLSNKDLYKAVGFLFNKFDVFDISFKSISMTKDFIFYIDIFNENFKIENNKSDLSYYNVSYVQLLFKWLKNIGYNPNAFAECENFSNSLYGSRNNWISLADRMDAYCDEHKIFYDSHNEFCPVCAKTKFRVTPDYKEKYNLVFEDSLARHYRIDGSMYLKVYKMLYENTRKVEGKIDEMIRGVLRFQDCFVPVKKALNSENQFVGYVYDAVSFDEKVSRENLCIDLKDTNNLANLPRIKCLIRLILQVKEMIKVSYFFSQNPFSHVFLSPNHKKQVQILNFEFIQRNFPGNGQDTVRWTCDYVCNVLSSDDNIEFDEIIAEYRAENSNYFWWLDKFLNELKILSAKMDRYCSRHKIYYTNNYVFCPKCVDKEKLNSLPILVEDELEYQNKKPINQGGESLIYPYGKKYGEKMVIKVFKKDAVNLNQKMDVLMRIFEKNDTLTALNKKGNKYEFIIPQMLIRDRNSQAIFAYAMKKVKGEQISLLKYKKEVEKLGFTRREILEILITIGRAIELLHDVNIFIGDLNGRNILFNKNKKVYFIDFDGIGVDELAPEFCTDMYIDPKSKKNKNITMKDDWYSFAVQAFHYLTYTHPFNGMYSVRDCGVERRLKTTEMMERKLSLLGNHGIEPPAVAEPWDWMIEELETAFLDTFEGDRRESIVPELVRQYKKLYLNDGNPEQESFLLSSENDESIKTELRSSSHPEIQKTLSFNNDCLNGHNTYRINSKFIATELKPFKGTVVRIFNEYSAVCKKGEKIYLAILVKDNDKIVQKNIHLQKYDTIKNVLLSGDEKLAFIVYQSELIVNDINSDSQIYIDNVDEISNVVVSERRLYFLGLTHKKSSNDMHIAMFKRVFMDDGEVKKDIADLEPYVHLKSFFANQKNDFMLINRTRDKDVVYYNGFNSSLSEMSYISDNCKYNIIYDNITKLWLVINSEGNGRIIEPKSKQVKNINIIGLLQSSDVNIANIYFRNGIIYLPSTECLHIVDVKDQMITKEMECQKIMTPDSKLFDFNAKGFSVISTDNKIYEIRKG